MVMFSLAMVMFPTVQSKAREQHDLAVGADRLPTPEDLDSLPYIQAIYMETLRWVPVLPLAVPHRAIAGDEYEDYYIPAGTIVIGVRRRWVCFSQVHAENILAVSAEHLVRSNCEY